MARTRGRSELPLSATRVKSIREPGRYGDGGRGSWGLYLRVYRRTNGRLSKTWGQRIRVRGRVTNLGLGIYPLVTLAEARAKALANRREIELGRDPRGVASLTFAEACERVIQLHSTGWKNPERMSGQWRQSFRDYAAPFASKPLAAITTADLLGALEPVWLEKPAAAKRALGRIAAVMKWAVGKGYRLDNPAGEALVAALPKQNGRVRHHAALPHSQLASALARVRASKYDPAARLALQFVALTAARSVEVREATWAEIDRKRAVWTIPAARMKTKREHRIPLSMRALELLTEARRLGSGVWIFPSARTGEALSKTAFWNITQRKLGGTVHGLRSSFRMWAGDTGVAREVAEAALAHTVRGVEAAYNRTDLFERRRKVMEDWAEYLGVTK